jgi:guanylate kinase
LIRTLLERVPQLQLAVSATTRQPRPGEEDGVHYHFLTEPEFDRRVVAGEFLEHAEYSGRRYGTLKSELQKPDVVLEIEVQGARQVAREMPEAVRIFIAPPSEDALRTRLIGRGHETDEQIDARLAVAKSELAAREEFQHVVVNDRLEDAADELERVVRAAL